MPHHDCLEAGASYPVPAHGNARCLQLLPWRYIDDFDGLGDQEVSEPHRVHNTLRQLPYDNGQLECLQAAGRSHSSHWHLLHLSQRHRKAEPDECSHHRQVNCPYRFGHGLRFLPQVHRELECHSGSG